MFETSPVPVAGRRPTPGDRHTGHSSDRSDSPKRKSSESRARRSGSYRQVKQHLLDGLASGRWAPGAQMPSESDLVARFGVSRMTVNRALLELQAESLVLRTQGLGTFAAPLHRVSSRLTIHDLQEQIEARGHRHHARVVVQQAEPAVPALAAQLGIGVGSPAFHTLIVHFENGMPLQCEDRYVNPAAAPDYLRADFTRITPTHHLFETTDLWRAQYRVEADRATAQEAALLQIEPGAPCLIVVRRTFSRSAAITIARLVHPGARYSLQGDFEP